MATNYYEPTGVLMLERVTPVISALFDAFNLDANYPGNGRAFIATIAETNDPQWSDVLEGLTTLSTQLNISPGKEPETTIDVFLKRSQGISTPIRTKISKTLSNIIRLKVTQTSKPCS